MGSGGEGVVVVPIPVIITADPPCSEPDRTSGTPVFVAITPAPGWPKIGGCARWKRSSFGGVGGGRGGVGVWTGGGTHGIVVPPAGASETGGTTNQTGSRLLPIPIPVLLPNTEEAASDQHVVEEEDVEAEV